jgi:hypothetical protein
VEILIPQIPKIHAADAKSKNSSKIINGNYVLYDWWLLMVVNGD